MAEQTRFSIRHPLGKALAALAVAILVTALLFAARTVGPVGRAIQDADFNVFYRRFYALRPVEDRRNSDVVIVAVDDGSEKEISDRLHYGWPWPRQFWGKTISYLETCGARCVVVDLLFLGPSQYKGLKDEKGIGDDESLARAIDAAKIPVILATAATESGQSDAFAPPVKKPPVFGAANVIDETVVNYYKPFVNGMASLAVRALPGNLAVPSWAHQPFLLHYYGSAQTYRYLNAANVVAAAFRPNRAKEFQIDPEMFRGKTVIIGAVLAGGKDRKASPLSDPYPGTELHATAFDNLVFGQRVRLVSIPWTLATALLASALAALAGIFPRRTTVKLIPGLLVIAAVLGTGCWLFTRHQIYFLPMVLPLAAAALSLLLGMAWSYLAQDRQARFLLKALSMQLSPRVAAQLEADHSRLSVSTETRELTILFSDIAGFTTISERLREGIGPLLNYYLDEMTESVFSTDGYLDKYIGDAVMAFWNAPLPQEDHAARACRAALAMQRRLQEIQPRLAELGAPGLHNRIGISSGVVAFGNMGSWRFKLNYSVIGDAANFSSRLEGANKFYGSNILIGEPTASVIRGQFALRKLDVLRVKGKELPVGVYELLGDDPSRAEFQTRTNLYESALSAYQRQDWLTAEKQLLDLSGQYPDDTPAKTLLDRVTRFRVEPPPPDWDGVYVAHEK